MTAIRNSESGMQVGFDGWQRSHGMKLMLSKSITETPIVDDWQTLKREDVAIKRYKNHDGKWSGVSINFYTDVRLGGSQMAEIKLSRKELVHLLKSCADDLTIGKFAEWLSQ